ncbi:hypothetical protein Pst134EA_032704 [Puccinia striiformis f. sp. tritici]|uniref:uncharacterized protein n=1 Tax=Puccinia striiformis f. sp. tritici TaxID=168172 RepID=UPI00200788C3|nr:uncharacterized protein Pst134EA_032704 [Puccinia striiformis f. sp. tritici]KAH9441653.1 hypothetical protein Pst134EA_032704 [Puccinia striiformis f. sp. tritici]
MPLIPAGLSNLNSKVESARLHWSTQQAQTTTTSSPPARKPLIQNQYDEESYEPAQPPPPPPVARKPTNVSSSSNLSQTSSGLASQWVRTTQYGPRPTYLKIWTSLTT